MIAVYRYLARSTSFVFTVVVNLGSTMLAQKKEWYHAALNHNQEFENNRCTYVKISYQLKEFYNGNKFIIYAFIYLMIITIWSMLDLKKELIGLFKPLIYYFAAPIINHIDILDAIYFAMATLSTCGAPSLEDLTRSNWVLIETILALFGVPIYSLAMSNIAAYILSR